MGMISVLRNYLPDPENDILGSFYILAPENAGYLNVSVDLSLHDNIWQYGSNNTSGGDPNYLQDGVAPQVKVTGLPDSKRVFITEDELKDFLEAHYTKNHGWVIERTINQFGYVKKRD